MDLLGVRPATLSGYLTAMENRGHLSRTRVEADRRSHRMELTAEGKAARNTCRARIRLAVSALNSALGTAEDVRAMRESLGRLDAAVLAAMTRLRGRI